MSIFRAIRQYRELRALAADIANLEADPDWQWMIKENPGEVFSLLGLRCRRLLK